MKLLITGSSGFIGGHLVKAAISRYGTDNVVALSSRPNHQIETIVYNREDFTVQRADLARIEAIDVVVHAGAFTPKSGQDANSPEGCNKNIYFTENLLSLPFTRLRNILYLSSLDVYEADDLIDESTRTLPTTLYGQSKLYCESMVTLFAAKAGIASQILRIGHVYGPGEEKYAKFLPTAIQRILAGKAVELWGDGSELRSFIYVDDVVNAILVAVELQEGAGTINIVGGTCISIRQLLDELIRISEKQVEVVVRESNRMKRDYVFDNTKFKTQLLAQETEMRTGLRTEYEYFEGLQ